MEWFGTDHVPNRYLDQSWSKSMMTSRWHNEVKRSIRNRNIHKRQSLIDALRNYYNNSISLARNNMIKIR